MICECGKPAYKDGECFLCRVKTIGYSFRGGGGYTREAFRTRTTNEFLLEHVGGTERELAKRTNVEKVT